MYLHFQPLKTKEVIPVKPKAGKVAAVFNEDSEVRTDSKLTSIKVSFLFVFFISNLCEY